jgi:hypothetical protein
MHAGVWSEILWEKKKPVEKSKRRSEDNIKMDLREGAEMA